MWSYVWNLRELEVAPVTARKAALSDVHGTQQKSKVAPTETFFTQNTRSVTRFAHSLKSVMKMYSIYACRGGCHG